MGVVGGHIEVLAQRTNLFPLQIEGHGYMTGFNDTCAHAHTTCLKVGGWAALKLKNPITGCTRAPSGGCGRYTSESAFEQAVTHDLLG